MTSSLHESGNSEWSGRAEIRFDKDEAAPIFTNGPRSETGAALYPVLERDLPHQYSPPFPDLSQLLFERARANRPEPEVHCSWHPLSSPVPLPVVDQFVFFNKIQRRPLITFLLTRPRTSRWSVHRTSASLSLAASPHENGRPLRPRPAIWKRAQHLHQLNQLPDRFVQRTGNESARAWLSKTGKPPPTSDQHRLDSIPASAAHKKADHPSTTDTHRPEREEHAQTPPCTCFRIFGLKQGGISGYQEAENICNVLYFRTFKLSSPKKLLKAEDKPLLPT
ncbi:MAG: hypothetical protein ACOX5Z_11620 [Desulfobulbus sp.]